LLYIKFFWLFDSAAWSCPPHHRCELTGLNGDLHLFERLDGHWVL